jgi:hypothetical protein
MRGANRNRAPSFWIALAAGDPHQSAFCGRPAAAPGRRAVERRDDARRPQARWCEPPAGFWFWSLPLMHFGVGIRRGRKPRFRELSWSHGTHGKPVAGRAEHGIGRPDHTLLRTRAKVNPYRSQLLELFRKPNLAPCCSVVAREKRLEVRQNCLLKDFAALVCAHRRLIRPQAHRISCIGIVYRMCKPAPFQTRNLAGLCCHFLVSAFI